MGQRVSGRQVFFIRDHYGTIYAEHRHRLARSVQRKLLPIISPILPRVMPVCARVMPVLSKQFPIMLK